MHIEYKKTNSLYLKFNHLRIKLGFTTFKSAVDEALRRMIIDENNRLQKENPVKTTLDGI